MDAGHVAHQHQAFAVAVAGDEELQAQVLVDRRGNLQRIGVLLLLEVLLEARMTHQVAHRLAAVLAGLEPEQGLRRRVPPYQVAAAVEHDHRVAQRAGGFLGAVDHRLQALAGLAVAPLQVVDAVEQFFPQAARFRHLGLRVGAFQPAPQTQQVAQQPAQIEHQAEGETPAVGIADEAEQQPAADQREQVAEQNAAPIGVQGESGPVREETAIGHAQSTGSQRPAGRARRQLLVEKR